MLALSPRVLKLAFKEPEGQGAWQLAGIKLRRPSEGTEIHVRRKLPPWN